MNKGFQGYHPIVNIITFASIVVFGMMFRHPVTLAVCFVAALIYYFRLSKRAALRSFFMFLLPMLFFVVLINALFAHYGITPLLVLPDGNRLTFESVAYGLVLGICVLSVIMWISCYSEVVTSDKFLCVFGKILPTGALVASMALRFLPLYRQRLKSISEAQQGLGKDYKCRGLINKIKNGGKILSALITGALENAIDTSDSMRARGYGSGKRKNYGKFKFGKKDGITLAAVILIDICLIFGYISKSLYCVYNPYVVINPAPSFGKSYLINELNLTVNPVSPLGILTVISFSLLCFLPIIIDVKEDIVWNRLKSKI